MGEDGEEIKEREKKGETRRKRGEEEGRKETVMKRSWNA